MSWLQLQLAATRDNADELEDALLEAGAAAVTLQDAEDQPIYEPGIGERPIWQNTRVTGLFPADCDIQGILLQLAATLPALPKHRHEILEDRDWEREWMDRYQPISFGERLWICPSWRQAPQPDACNLMLDPGLAFGTGTHPTTALCMEWLDSAELNDKIIIDYGCGSGILGLAALLLGGRALLAVDNDPQALLATRENARRNNISEEKYRCALPDDAGKEHADILLANILAQPLIGLATTLSARVNSGGQIVLSGILESQADAVWQAYAPAFEQATMTSRDGWVRISAIRRQ